MKLIAIIFALYISFLNVLPLFQIVSDGAEAMHCEASCCSSESAAPSNESSDQQETDDDGCSYACNPFSRNCSCTLFQLPTPQRLSPALIAIFNAQPIYSLLSSQAYLCAVWEPPRLG